MPKPIVIDTIVPKSENTVIVAYVNIIIDNIVVDAAPNTDIPIVSIALIARNSRLP